MRNYSDTSAGKQFSVFFSCENETWIRKKIFRFHSNGCSAEYLTKDLRFLFAMLTQFSKGTVEEFSILFYSILFYSILNII